VSYFVSSLTHAHTPAPQILAQMQAQAVAAQRELSRVRAQSSSLEGARRRAELTRRQVEEEKDATLWVGRGKM
jgi:molecular chaperone DnaK (HSP70)